MSLLRIADGTGKGNLAKVDENNRLLTVGVSESRIKNAGERGNAFAFSVHNIAVPGGNVPTNVGYVSFDDPNRLFYWDSVTYSWNGGSTTYNKPLCSTMNLVTAPPTANHFPMPWGNTNFSSADVALATGYMWTGAGAGMTIAAGLPMFSQFFPIGTHAQFYHGAMICGKGIAVAFEFKSPEAGVASFVVVGWYEG